MVVINKIYNVLGIHSFVLWTERCLTDNIIIDIDADDDTKVDQKIEARGVFGVRTNSSRIILGD